MLSGSSPSYSDVQTREPALMSSRVCSGLYAPWIALANPIANPPLAAIRLIIGGFVFGGKPGRNAITTCLGCETDTAGKSVNPPDPGVDRVDRFDPASASAAGASSASAQTTSRAPGRAVPARIIFATAEHLFCRSRVGMPVA